MCNILSQLVPDAKQAKELKEKIADEYRVNMWGDFSTTYLSSYSHFPFLNIWKILHLRHCRILDNLPLVVPLRRSDQNPTPVYQLGYHVGLKGQYSGVYFYSEQMTLSFHITNVVFIWVFFSCRVKRSISSTIILLSLLSTIVIKMAIWQELWDFRWNLSGSSFCHDFAVHFYSSTFDEKNGWSQC